MKIKLISGQKGKNLLDFYSPNEWSDHWGKMAEMMTQLIVSLDKIDYEPVWAFTSHAELLFTDKDDHEYWKVLVKIVRIEEKQFYKIMTAQKLPWHSLVGFADNPKVATDLVIAGLNAADHGRSRNIFFDSY